MNNNIDPVERLSQIRSKYSHSQKGKESILKYQQSEKGQETRRKYQNSEKGRITRLKYYNSEKAKKNREEKQALKKTLCGYMEHLKDYPNCTMEEYLRILSGNTQE